MDRSARCLPGEHIRCLFASLVREILVSPRHDPRVVRAVIGHWLFGYIHPCADGNGRVARFVMNVLLASGDDP